MKKHNAVKVFSTKKWLIETKKSEISEKEIKVCLNSWIPKCEGKTQRECNKLGFGILDNWLVTKQEYKKEVKA